MSLVKRRPYQLIVGFLMLIIALSITGTSLAMAGNSRRSAEFQGQVATGLNTQLGNVLFKFPFMPSPWDDSFKLTTLGVHNPNGPDPLPLTAATPDDAILSTNVDTNGVPMLPAPDPALVNLPLRKVETWVPPPDLLQRGEVPSHLLGPVVGSTQAEPNDPITKGDWFSASGKMKVKCSPNGNSVKMRLNNLIPNRLYTVWGIWLDPTVPGFTPVPLGGVPNVVMTDDKGDGTFERELNFCPMEAAEQGIDGKTLAFIDAHLHSDHIAYGAIPLPAAGGFPPGSVLHLHVTFNLGAGVPN